MYASIHFNPSINDVLNYHEEKVEQKVAELIVVENFIVEKEGLSFAEKAFPFELRASYREDIDNKIFHTAITFGKDEKIADSKMAAVGRDYLQAMGYGEQPYLIYRHSDTDRPHIHLVAANIDRDGEGIGISKFALLRSQQLTEELAKKYGLQARYPDMGDSLQEALEKMQPGSDYLYPAMNRILEEVIPQYRYTNLVELNAVLRLYKIEASRGKENTITRKRQGLHYHLLQPDGQLSKQYFPARQFRIRPTLHYLERKFAENAGQREEHRASLATLVDYVLAGQSFNLGALQQALARRKVRLTTQEDKETGTQVWYIDHRNKTVFEGASLGQAFTFAAMQQRLVPDEVYRQRQETQQQNQQQHHHHSL